MLTTKEKQKLIEKHKISPKDTGSSEVQIAIITEQIKQLTSHLKENPKDHHSRKGLLKMVAKRKSLMDFLKKRSPEKHAVLVKKAVTKKKVKK